MVIIHRRVAAIVDEVPRLVDDTHCGRQNCSKAGRQASGRAVESDESRMEDEEQVGVVGR